MAKLYQTSLFLFRRDLRLEDNPGLMFALKQSESVIPAFILTPEQIDHNAYRSEHCVQFMLECLQDLEAQLKKKKGMLYIFKGHPDEVVKACISKLHIDALIVNRDYTPYSIKRDKKLEQLCKKGRIAFHSFDDALLHPPEAVLKKDGKPYTVFTPYFRNAIKDKIASPLPNRRKNYFRDKIPFAKALPLPEKRESIRLRGGRSEALKAIKKSLKNFPAEKGSTHFSPYLKFNVCSIREVYHALSHRLGAHHPLIRSLYWRDFFTGIALFFPHVFKGCFRQKFDRLKWSYDKKAFNRWCQGKTGFPLIDAGMREMNETGFMHNRVRMVAASFLVKDLNIDWKWGEKYFAQTLIDYDPCVNNGNWQWVASVGCDAQPYFRIFNPWNQQKKFDPDCRYIKQWIPELRALSPKTIHAWHQTEHHETCKAYPPPMIDHDASAKKSIAAYRAVI